MIELELPCCGGTTRLAELADDIRCEDCGVAVELAPASAAAAPAPTTAARLPALAA